MEARVYIDYVMRARIKFECKAYSLRDSHLLLGHLTANKLVVMSYLDSHSVSTTGVSRIAQDIIEDIRYCKANSTRCSGFFIAPSNAHLCER